MAGIVFSRTRRVFASPSDQVYTIVVVINLFQGLQSAVFVSPSATAFNKKTLNCKVASHQDLLEGFPEYITKNLTPGVPIWLPIIRKYVNDSAGWFWISGDFYKNELSRPPWHKKGMDCAALRAGDGIIDDANCNASYSMYMCDPTPGCNCNQRVVCIEHRGEYYSIHVKSGNWYKALQGCKERGTKLAVLIADREAILLKIKKQLQKYAHPDVWIGLRMKEYQWTDGTQVEEFSWAPGSPCVCPEWNCVAAMKEGDRIVWKQQDCQNKSHHLCVALPSHIPTSASPPPKQNTATARSTTDGTFPLIIAMVIVLCILMAGLVFYFCFWRPRKQNQPQSNKQALEPLHAASSNEEENTGQETFSPTDMENMSAKHSPIQQVQAQNDKESSDDSLLNSARMPGEGSSQTGDHHRQEDEEKQKIEKMINKLAKLLALEYYQGHKEKQECINRFVNGLKHVELDQIRPGGLEEVILMILKAETPKNHSLNDVWSHWKKKLKKYNIPKIEKITKRLHKDFNVSG